MGKLAITYYRDLMRGISDVRIHKSGKVAIDHFKLNVGKYFTQPVIFKSEPRIAKDKTYCVHVGFRSYNVRFLDDDEVAVYQQYGDDAWINYETARLVKPDSNPNDRIVPPK